MYCFPDLCYKSEICDLTDELDILASFIGWSSSMSKGEIQHDLMELLLITYMAIDVLRDQGDLQSFQISLINEIKKKYSQLNGGKHNKTIYEKDFHIFICSIDLCRSYSKKIKTLYYNIFSGNYSENQELQKFLHSLPDVFDLIAAYLKNYKLNV
ncbi:hypothetical protein [uncultured Ilyobacter sp.]|uniref:hypothetical protein n=1 Tax=uncultured Ilyobacter sp. TaxID=544433 RepID=UPI0029C69202|nr:hypothetical protein [uncultured Ilyobacter sp.]